MEKAETETSLLESTISSTLKFFGRLITKLGECLEKEIVEATGRTIHGGG